MVSSAPICVREGWAKILITAIRFLLKYVSRDVIELLGRGNGGIVEIRNTIAQQEELAPLFGFLRYRRRNVLIKYVPEECSRLVQGEILLGTNIRQENGSQFKFLP